MSATSDGTVADVPTDTVTLAALEEIVQAAAAIAETPYAGIGVIDLTGARSIAMAGMPAAITPADGSVVDLVVRAGTEVEIELDADPRFTDARHPEGGPAVAWFSGFPLRVDGRVAGTLGIFDDHTHPLSEQQRHMLRLLARQAETLWTLSRRAAEQQNLAKQLQDERDQSHALLGAIREGYVYTVDGVIVTVNDAFCELTGFSSEELVGSRAPFPFWPAGYSDSHLDKTNAMKSDGGGVMEMIWKRRDGSQFDVSLSSHRVVTPGGETGGFISLATDISIRKDEERRLRHRADHDGLTGLLNQTASHHAIRAEVAGCQAVSDGLSLAIIDLDRFKQVNDTYGHAAGDAVLVELAIRLRRHARQADRIGRIGGEEFVWLMPQTGLREATQAVERVAASVRDEPFPLVGPVTFSAGVAELAHDDTMEALLRRADIQLYAAKNMGRDRVHAVPPAQRLA